jgi:hypothetical protein
VAWHEFHADHLDDEAERDALQRVRFLHSFDKTPERIAGATGVVEWQVEHVLPGEVSPLALNLGIDCS